MRKTKTLTTEDVLITLCDSVTRILTKASGNQISYSAMVQKINRTCLRPDIGCFVLFDGGFNGIVVTNFSAGAALEIYHDYMRNMGMPENEIANSHLSDDVGDVLGELMNQIVGNFTLKVREDLQTMITQSQPKMLVLNKLVQISIESTMDRPQVRRVTFTTKSNHIFYLEFAMDKTEFIKLHDFEIEKDINPDDIIDASKNPEEKAPPAEDSTADDDFLAALGL